jgi:hypothetical protein
VLRLGDDGSLLVHGELNVGAVPASGAGSRLVWYPGKHALRAGRLDSFAATYWDETNIGHGSVAFGENTRARGNSSVAMGLHATATGHESVALGYNGTASANRAFAFNGIASAVGAVAIGSGAQATNDDSLALGPSSIAGGPSSIVLGPSIANGNFATAIGVNNQAYGNFAVAIGKNARANHQGSVVISDASAVFASSDFVGSTGSNQFIVRGSGGIFMYTSMNLSSGVTVPSGGGAWSSVSDRAKKENVEAVDGEDVLLRLRQVPVTRWNYRTQLADIRHMGPMAQDFHAAFGLGEDQLTISSVDADGVALAGVKALDARTDSQRQRIERLEQENTALRERLERLEALLAQPRD